MDDELKVLAKLLLPYRQKVGAWARLTPDDGRRPVVAGGVRRHHADCDGSAGCVRRCGVSAPRRDVRPADAVELYESGLSLRQVGARLGMSHTAVKHRLLVTGVRLRLPSSQAPPMCRLPEHLEVSVLTAERHLLSLAQAVALDPAPVPSRQHVTPERAAVAITAACGWHMTERQPAGSATCSPSSTDRHGPAPTCPRGGAAPWVQGRRSANLSTSS
jgi:hypothetical protein